jgi:phage anti-repressor protein/phage antirepressor YoqD-like protein
MGTTTQDEGTGTLIPVYRHNGELTINARDLHKQLGSGQIFANWIKNRIEQYGFEEGKDYLINLLNRSDGLPGKPRKEYYFTVPAAKELCMVENNDIGRQVRKYLIKVEEDWNSDEKVLARAVQIMSRKLEEQQTVLEDQDALIKDQSALLEEQTALLEAQTTHIEEQRAVKRDLDSTVEMQRRTNWKLCRDIAKQRRVTGELCEHIEKLEPKAEYYDKMVEHGDSSTNLRITALQIKAPLGQFIQFLLEGKFIYYQNKSSKKEGFLPYNKYVAGDADKRYFEVKDFYDKRSHVHGRQTLVTMLGKQYFATAVKEWERRRADLERQESLDMEVSIARPAGNCVNVIKQPRLAFDKLGQDYE